MTLWTLLCWKKLFSPLCHPNLNYKQSFFQHCLLFCIKFLTLLSEKQSLFIWLMLGHQKPLVLMIHNSVSFWCIKFKACVCWPKSTRKDFISSFVEIMFLKHVNAPSQPLHCLGTVITGLKGKSSLHIHPLNNQLDIMHALMYKGQRKLEIYSITLVIFFLSVPS